MRKSTVKMYVHRLIILSLNTPISTGGHALLVQTKPTEQLKTCLTCGEPLAIYKIVHRTIPYLFYLRPLLYFQTKLHIYDAVRAGKDQV